MPRVLDPPEVEEGYSSRSMTSDSWVFVSDFAVLFERSDRLYFGGCEWLVSSAQPRRVCPPSGRGVPLLSTVPRPSRSSSDDGSAVFVGFDV